jgi:hypothetical protein
MDANGYIPIKIAKRRVTVTAGSATKVYDGKELKNPNAYITFGSVVNGDVFEAITTGSITEAGTAVNTVAAYRVTDSKGEDITYNYEFTFIDGELTVLENE